MYDIIFDKEALRDLNKLDRVIKERIWSKLQECKQDPFHFFEKLSDMDGFKLRIGDWRVIADLDRAGMIIKVLKVGHRKNIYER